MKWVQLCSSLNILWHCLSLRLIWKLTFSSPVATAEFSKCTGILSEALGSPEWTTGSTGFPDWQMQSLGHLSFHSCVSQVLIVKNFFLSAAWRALTNTLWGRLSKDVVSVDISLSRIPWGAPEHNYSTELAPPWGQRLAFIFPLVSSWALLLGWCEDTEAAPGRRRQLWAFCWQSQKWGNGSIPCSMQIILIVAITILKFWFISHPIIY